MKEREWDTWCNSCGHKIYTDQARYKVKDETRCHKCRKKPAYKELKKPIRKRVLREVWRHFCPECGKQVAYHNHSGGMEGDQGYWDCPYCGWSRSK